MHLHFTRYYFVKLHLESPRIALFKSSRRSRQARIPNGNSWDTAIVFIRMSIPSNASKAESAESFSPIGANQGANRHRSTTSIKRTRASKTARANDGSCNRRTLIGEFYVIPWRVYAINVRCDRVLFVYKILYSIKYFSMCVCVCSMWVCVFCNAAPPLRRFTTIVSCMIVQQNWRKLRLPVFHTGTDVSSLTFATAR